MPIEIRVPQLGESVVEATIAQWLKKEGDSVALGDPVVELETEKVNVEVPADAAGVLRHIQHHEGETVRVGDVLAVLEDGAGATPGPAAGASAGAPVAAPAETPPSGHGPGLPPRPADGVPAAAPAETPRPVTPVARRLAEEHGLDYGAIAGSGPGGRVMKEDVLDALERPPAAPPDTASAAPVSPPAPATSAAALPPPAPAGPAPRPGPTAPAAPLAGGGLDGRPEERIPLSRRRLTIARRLVEAQQTAAMLTTFNEVDMTNVMDLRKRRRDAFKERYGVNLQYNSFFVKATIGALKAFPAVNAELQGDELVLKRYFDIGIAVSTEEGLVVPVIRDADRKSFAEIERVVVSLATRARERKLTLEELRGGTFTITNGGVFGSLLSTPILNPPQVGILGLHKIEERPVAVSGQVVVRPMMYAALTYDHRVVDGREAVSFLVRFKELIEDPERLLVEG